MGLNARDKNEGVAVLGAGIDEREARWQESPQTTAIHTTAFRAQVSVFDADQWQQRINASLMLSQGADESRRRKDSGTRPSRSVSRILIWISLSRTQARMFELNANCSDVVFGAESGSELTSQSTRSIPVQKTHEAKATTASGKMSRKEFEEELAKLQVELVRLQNWVQATRARVIVIFEGRDTAGKGGVISRITARTSPRVYRHVALPAPSDREKTQVYIQRYMAHFPAAGEIILFDRSWYNRAGVERVMGFCTDEEYERFLAVAPVVEREIAVNMGILM
jgi:Polyphosphate kinase 2 (PPK2)